MISLHKIPPPDIVGYKAHFKSNCPFPIDVIGIVEKYERVKNETIYIINSGGRKIKIGSNHCNMMVEILEKNRAL